MIGEMLVNRYEILEKIGDGGMALVYSAKDHLLSRIVAVKVLRAQFADDEEFVERFRREARSAASLSHPNIVNIYDVGQMGQIHFIVMEFVHGKNLHDLIREGEFSEEFIVNVGKQIAMGLAHAHYHGIIHRDIKPHNILLTDEGRVKVTDFGIAQAMSTTNLTQTGVVLGSVHYFSPEQARGVNVQAASDLYSLGIVLYEMITGKVPFRGDSPIAIALKQIQENPPPLRGLVSELDGDLEDLVLRLLSKDVGSRPASAAAVVEAFERIERRQGAARGRLAEQDQAGLGPGAAKKGGFRLGRSKKKRGKKGKAAPRRSRVVLVLALLLVLVGLGFAVVRMIPAILFPNEVKVPNVVGLLEGEARRVLGDAGLRLAISQSVFDNEKPEGYVISQDPLAGRMVKEQREIQVRLSKGPEEVEMLSVLGISTREAKLALTQAGFVLGTEDTVYDPEVDPNLVLEQWPQPGEIVIKGSAVDLVISKEQEAAPFFDLPDFRGRQFELVKAQLAELGLVLGNSWPEHSTSYSTGQVVEQNPGAGSQVQAGWKIDFVYSQGQPSQAELPEFSDPSEQEDPLWSHENLWKTAEVSVYIPEGADQEIVILVIDDFGAREVYREIHKGGSRVVRTVQGRGAEAKLQVYIGGRQFKDEFF